MRLAGTMARAVRLSHPVKPRKRVKPLLSSKPLLRKKRVPLLSKSDCSLKLFVGQMGIRPVLRRSRAIWERFGLVHPSLRCRRRYRHNLSFHRLPSDLGKIHCRLHQVA